MDRFSKEKITKVLNEKDAKVIYQEGNGLVGSKR